MISAEHINRVKKELAEAGVTGYGLVKSESRYLPQIIHENEHIGGAVYGQFGSGSAMLIATDHRIIFLDRKPMFTTNDELTYDVVSGVKLNQGGLFTAVTLHTRVADYALRYVNLKCARRFVKYIESRRLESNDGQPVSDTVSPAISSASSMPFLDDSAQNFLKSHDIAVLSSVDRTGNVYGAVVYYLVGQLGRIYILTKSSTTKARNILAHGQVSLTIFEENTARTLNIQGDAEYETDQKIKDFVFHEIVKPRSYDGEVQPPPVTKLSEGSFTVIHITPSSGKYTDYKQTKA
ncbi:pyridoxamine 5'-phosphate oxidase family protein [Candidatus Saccharibacteria bacterium]|nr:pyridoxamine 5'-phosphate oxidase family protein [Candidatus Saccharibacteria bacterium]MBI3337697.1 pyridoxamine 5'-phosphate oxidase family protein [Candidatus Saccharibacteria bacterium]